MKTTPTHVLFIVLGSLIASMSAARAAAPAGRYTIAGPAGKQTVLDTKTKLTWERSFQAEQTLADARSRCASLGATVGGTGWRLPTMKELLTLVDYVTPQFPAALIDLDAFPNTTPTVFWTTTPALINPPFIRIVDFGSGEDGATDGSNVLASRCVR